MKKNDRFIYVVILVTVIVSVSILAIGSRTPFSAASSSSVPTATVTPSPEPTPDPTPEPTPSPTPTPVYNVKLSAVGDLMLHEWQANNAYDKASDSYDFEYCFDDVREYLSSADFTIGNLETTFAGKAAGYAYYPVFNAPDAFGDAIKNAGFDFLTTVNNHSNDKREAGIIRTLDILDELGIDHTGTFRSPLERDHIYIKEINNIRFAILSYTYGTNGIPLTDGKPYLANLLDEELFRSDIARAKALKPDFIIVLPHMGAEYETYPRESYKKTIHSMLEAGADIVLASHPHVLQTADFITITDENNNERECLVVYSMGNFISSQRTVPRDAGVIFNLYFEKHGDEKAVLKNVGYVPTWVKFTDISGKYDIRVLPVYDTLTAHEQGLSTSLRASDINRLKQVHNEAGMIYMNKQIPLEEAQAEYFIK